MNVTETPGRNECYLSCRICEAQKKDARLLVAVLEDVLVNDAAVATLWRPSVWFDDVFVFMQHHTHSSLFPFELAYRFDAAYAKRENEHAEAIRALGEQLRVRAVAPAVEVQTSGKKKPGVRLYPEMPDLRPGLAARVNREFLDRIDGKKKKSSKRKR